MRRANIMQTKTPCGHCGTIRAKRRMVASSPANIVLCFNREMCSQRVVARHRREYQPRLPGL